MSSKSKKSVMVAVTSNIVVTIAKFIAFALSGSGALLSEAIHSVADTSNQALLWLGLVRAAREPDERHPYGYGRARFFWGLVRALAIFFVGAGVTLYHGFQALVVSDRSEHSWVTWAVFVISFLAEGTALFVAIRGIAHEARAEGVSFARFVREGRDPTAIAVVLEDSAALLGLLFAIVGIGLEIITGQPVWDALATISIGVLLAVVAVFLVAKNRVYLLTKSVDDEVVRRAREVIESDAAVERISRFRAVIMGLDRYQLAADVEFDGEVIADHLLADRDLDELVHRTREPEALRELLREFGDEVVTALGDEVDALEERIRRELPRMKDVEIETD